MNLTLRRFQISKTGTHRDSKGAKHLFTSERLENAAERYSRRIKDGGNRAPLFIGHPDRENGSRAQSKALGLVNGLEFQDGKLYATAYLTDELLSLVRRGTYKHVSAGFTGQELELDHIAFLNNPAVKGMEALDFSEQDGLIMFAAPLAAEFHTDRAELNAAPAAVDFASDPDAWHAAALSYQQKHGVSYEAAARSVIREQAASANFSESSNAHHEAALAYQAAHQCTYEEAARRTAGRFCF